MTILETVFRGKCHEHAVFEPPSVDDAMVETYWNLAHVENCGWATQMSDELTTGNAKGSIARIVFLDSLFQKKKNLKTWNSVKFKNGEHFWEKKTLKTNTLLQIANTSYLKVNKCHFLSLFFGGSAHTLWKPLSNYLVRELCHSALLISPGRLLCFSPKKTTRCKVFLK